MSQPLDLGILPQTFAVSRLEAGEPVPDWAWTGEVACVARTRDELSIVCAEAAVPAGVRCEAGWRCLKVEGPLDFALTGIMAALAVPLATAGIPIFVFSTFDTDYLLVKASSLGRAIEALTAMGHCVAARENFPPGA